MVLVSHDRHLLRTATDSLMLVADGGLRAVRRRPGGLPRLARRAPSRATSRSRMPARSARAEARRGRGTPGARQEPQAARDAARYGRGGHRTPRAREGAARREARVRVLLSVGRSGRGHGGAARAGEGRRGAGKGRGRVAGAAGAARGDRLTAELTIVRADAGIQVLGAGMTTRAAPQARLSVDRLAAAFLDRRRGHPARQMQLEVPLRARDRVLDQLHHAMQQVIVEREVHALPDRRQQSEDMAPLLVAARLNARDEERVAFRGDARGPPPRRAWRSPPA